MNLSRPFILRPVATTLLMLAVVLAGLLAFRQLPVAALPQVDYPTIQVQTFYPGAGPEVMASSVTAPLERQFGQMPGLNQMTSSSARGASTITLQFALDLPIDAAEQQVQAAINAASSFLPRDLPAPPIYSKVNPADTPILTLGLTSQTLPLPTVHDLADTRLAQKIAQLPGVGLVRIAGGQKPALRIQVNPRLLSGYGLSLEELRAAIAQATVNQAKGSFDGERQAYTILANDQLSGVEEFRALVVAYRNGAPVRLSDLAEVVEDAENLQQGAWMNGRPAVIVTIQRQPGANTIEVVDRIQRLLPQLRSTLPAAIEVTVLSDRTVGIRASVWEVELELLFTIALVVLVIFLFLRELRATLIPAVAVPLSLVGSFGAMYLLGFSLNNLTLMALTIATGFVVDDAIVMLENIVRHLEQGLKPLEAALKGSSQIGFTILALTVSLVAVLIPLLFMGDVVGRLFREFAVTLSVTILISALVSLTLTPMLCAKLLRHRPEGERSGWFRASERAFQGLIGGYGATLRAVLRRRPWALVGAAATLALTGLLYLLVPKGFFPVQDTGLVLGISEAPQSVSFQAMAERQQALARVILADPAVAGLSSFVGVDGSNATLNSGRLQIDLKPLEERRVGALEVIRRLQPALAKVPGITLYLQPVQDLTVEDRISRTQFQYTLESADPRELAVWVPRLVERLKAAPALRDVASDQQDEGLQLKLEIDRATAARLGITPQLIDDTLYDAFGQRQIALLFTQLNQYRVVLEVKPEFRQGPANLDDIYLRPAGGGATPLSGLVRPHQTLGPLAIHRQGQFPVATVSFNLASDASLGAAVEAVERAKRELALPDSVQGSFQGTARAFLASLDNQPLLLLAAVTVLYIVLGVLYESYAHPATILSTLPSAAVGALLALLAVGDDLNVVSLIGIVLLIGIVAKNAIMMIDFALDAQRKDGLAPEEAIVQACLIRFRPILMTTLAAILAGVPLALGSGTGWELRRPLGVTIIGGLLFSQLITLYTTPAVYLGFDRLSRWLAGQRTATAR